MSVITRTYKGREIFLRQATLSVAHQTWPNIEHIIVEDGGETMRDLCLELATITGKKIKYLSNDKNNRAIAGNMGLEAALGRWCLFLDDDDLLFADHIETLAGEMMDKKDAAACYSLSWQVMTNTKNFPQRGFYHETMYEFYSKNAEKFDFENLLKFNYFPIQSVLFDRNLYLVRGGFDKNFQSLEDWILWVKYAYKQRFIHVPKITSIFRTPADKESIMFRNRIFDRAYPFALQRNKENLTWIDKLQNEVIREEPRANDALNSA